MKQVIDAVSPEPPAARTSRRRAKAIRYRRAYSLVSYWHDGDLVVENFLRREPMAVTADVVRVLDACGDWVEADHLAVSLGNISAEEAQEAAEALHVAGLLFRDDEDVSRDNLVASHWGVWSIESSFAHFATKEAPYIENVEDERALVQEITDSEPPPLFKHDPDAARIMLPRVPVHSEARFWDVLFTRRTHRVFTGEKVPLDTFSFLIASAFGPTRFIDAEHFGTLMLKTSACGGARQEHEVYIAAFDVEGVAPGIWHYSALDHSLERVGNLDRERVKWLCYEQQWCADAAFLCFLTAMLSRVTAKYRHSRSYRAMLLNAGHVGQTFALVATALGLGPLQTAAMRDEEVEALLGIDGISETLMYLMGAGRPQFIDGKMPDGASPMGIESAARTRLY